MVLEVRVKHVPIPLVVLDQELVGRADYSIRIHGHLLLQMLVVMAFVLLSLLVFLLDVDQQEGLGALGIDVILLWELVH